MKNNAEDLVKAAVSGDVKAFEKLYKLYRNTIFDFTLSMLKHLHDAEDATQQTFVKVYEQLPTLHHPEMFSLWIRRIARNESMMILRKRRRELPSESFLTEDEALIDEDEIWMPSVVIERKDMLDRVRKAIEALPLSQREALVLQLYHHMTIEQIAYVTDTNVNTVKSRLYYARRHIKKALNKDIEQLDGIALIPFGVIYLKVFEEDLPKRRKAKGSWKRLRSQLLTDRDSIDKQIEKLLPSDHGSAYGVAVKIAAVLFIGALMTTSFSAAFSEAPEGNFIGSQSSAHEQVLPVAEKPAAPPEQNNEKPADRQTSFAAPDNNMRTARQQDFIQQPDSVQQQESIQPQENVTQHNNLAADTPVVAGARQEEPKKVIVPPTIAPTEKPTDTPTEEPSAPPTTESPENKLYTAYQKILEDDAADIEMYGTMRQGQPKQFVLANVYGDETPELLYLSQSAGDDKFRLTVATYENDRTKTINRTYDLPAESGFALLIADGVLYSCVSTPSTDKDAALPERYYYRYTDSSSLDYHYNDLQDVLLMHRTYNNAYHYSLSNEGEITAEAFAEAEKDLLNSVDTVLFAENTDLLSEDLRQIAAQKQISGMTYAEMKNFLKNM